MHLCLHHMWTILCIKKTKRRPLKHGLRILVVAVAASRSIHIKDLAFQTKKLKINFLYNLLLILNSFVVSILKFFTQVLRV